MSPSKGPGNKIQATDNPKRLKSDVARAIEAMVMANPTEFWMAKTAPTWWGGAAWADNAEDCGESATTAAPHTRKMASNSLVWSLAPVTATIEQQSPEIASARAATRPLPILRLNNPPRMHPTAPIAMMMNARPGTLRWC